MTDLIIHIGLPKCGSTTLQREVFAHEQGYLGTHPAIPRGDNLAKQLQQCGPFGGRQTLSRRALHRWAEHVRALKAERWPGIDRLIASDEVLGSSSRFETRPIVRLLRTLNESIWQEGAVKAVIVFRNQAERLASGYAQTSNCRINPGQADFEAELATRLKDPRPYDYAAWLTTLEDALGVDNVCPLLLEESNTESFWQRLQAFAHLRALEPEHTVTGDDAQNRRRAGADQWQISAFDPQFKAKVAVDKPLNLIWPKHFATGPRGFLRDALIARVARHYQRIHAHDAIEPRATAIMLTPEARARIAQHLSDSNQALAQRLGRPIAGLGYE